MLQKLNSDEAWGHGPPLKWVVLQFIHRVILYIVTKLCRVYMWEGSLHTEDLATTEVGRNEVQLIAARWSPDNLI